MRGESEGRLSGKSERREIEERVRDRGERRERAREERVRDRGEMER